MRRGLAATSKVFFPKESVRSEDSVCGHFLIPLYLNEKKNPQGCHYHLISSEKYSQEYQSSHFYASDGHIYLWNPRTNKHGIIHGGGYGGSVDSRLSYGLGFGHNSALNDYEIVKLVSTGDRLWMSDLSVYNVSKGEWLVTEKIPYKVCYMRQGLFFNGAVHWIGASGSRSPHVVIAYDFGVRKFRKMKLPNCKKANWINVSVLDGCLCLLCDYDSHVEVWAMKEYGVKDSWVTLFAGAEHKNYVGVTVSGEFLLQKTGGGLCLYDPRRKNRRDLATTDDSTQYLSLGTRFEDSLLPPAMSKGLCKRRTS